MKHKQFITKYYNNSSIELCPELHEFDILPIYKYGNDTQLGDHLSEQIYARLIFQQLVCIMGELFIRNQYVKNRDSIFMLMYERIPSICSTPKVHFLSV